MRNYLTLPSYLKIMIVARKIINSECKNIVGTINETLVLNLRIFLEH